MSEFHSSSTNGIETEGEWKELGSLSKEIIGFKHMSELEKGEKENDFKWRSILIGTTLGCFLSAQNVYFGLKNGMSFGDGMVASILGYGLIQVLKKCIPFQHFNLHEHVILQTAAAANISVVFSGGFTQYILAMTPQVQQANNLGKKEDTWTPNYWTSVGWLLLAGYLGFFISQFYRQKLIIEQRHPWPNPTATALVLKSFHQGNEDGKMIITRKIATTTFYAFFWQWFKWLFNAKGQMMKWPILGATAAKYSWYADWSTAYIAGGMLTTSNAVFSMVLGGLYGYGLILPYVLSKEGEKGWYLHDTSSMKDTKAYWFLSSLSIVVVDSIYQSLLVIFISLKPFFYQKTTIPINLYPPPNNDPTRLISSKFWILAFLINAILLVVVLPFIFPVTWYLILPVILLAIPLGYGVCLGGAITGTFIISAVGKIIILIFGSISGNVLGALWLSGIGMITVGSSEQLLVDYQIAHITGTSPKQMFKAQVIAATFGFFIAPLSYSLFMNAFKITTNGEFTAPGGVALRSLAILVVDGLDTLPGNIEWFLLSSSLLGLCFSLGKDILPPKYSRYVPNTMAFAVGFYVNGSFPLNALIGLIIRSIWKAMSPKSEERFSSIVAGGMIAGEGLAAIFQALLAIGGIDPPASLAIEFSVWK